MLIQLFLLAAFVAATPTPRVTTRPFTADPHLEPRGDGFIDPDAFIASVYMSIGRRGDPVDFDASDSSDASDASDPNPSSSDDDESSSISSDDDPPPAHVQTVSLLRLTTYEGQSKASPDNYIKAISQVHNVFPVIFDTSTNIVAIPGRRCPDDMFGNGCTGTKYQETAENMVGPLRVAAPRLSCISLECRQYVEVGNLTDI